jgi:hypothetical protein
LEGENLEPLHIYQIIKHVVVGRGEVNHQNNHLFDLIVPLN